ncbi:MAG: succinylglutamate desuccinylase/aspartoacylase family protein [Geminicoccaceae bacterium]
MTDRKSRIWSEVDLAATGKQVGFLHLPYSVTRSGYGHINIPIAVISGGGPGTALLTGGNHGDEFEGQIALARLIRDLRPEDVPGRVIIIPALNFPAAMASTRVSPIDQGNLNRAFPGDPDATPTWQIAHYIDSVLLPQSDLWVDIHSGGTSMQYLPFAHIYLTGDDPELDARSDSLLLSFGSPRSVRVTFRPDSRFAASTAHRRRVAYLGTELGGGGGVNREGVEIARAGCLRALHGAGILRDLSPYGVSKAVPTEFFEWAGNENYVYAEHPGVFEPHVGLGEPVTAGQPCGTIHFIEDPRRESIQLTFQRPGTVACLRHPGRVEPGDCVSHTVIPLGAA